MKKSSKLLTLTRWLHWIESCMKFNTQILNLTKSLLNNSITFWNITTDCKHRKRTNLSQNLFSLVNMTHHMSSFLELRQSKPSKKPSILFRNMLNILWPKKSLLKSLSKIPNSIKSETSMLDQKETDM